MPAIASKLIEELFRISERFRDGRFGVQQEVGGRAVRVAWREVLQLWRSALIS
jgi:hypothetical protein